MEDLDNLGFILIPHVLYSESKNKFHGIQDPYNKKGYPAKEYDLIQDQLSLPFLLKKDQIIEVEVEDKFISYKVTEEPVVRFYANHPSEVIVIVKELPFCTTPF